MSDPRSDLAGREAAAMPEQHRERRIALPFSTVVRRCAGMAAGEPISYVTVLQRAEGCPADQAVDEVAGASDCG